MSDSESGASDDGQDDDLVFGNSLARRLVGAAAWHAKETGHKKDAADMSKDISFGQTKANQLQDGLEMAVDSHLASLVRNPARRPPPLDELAGVAVAACQVENALEKVGESLAGWRQRLVAASTDVRTMAARADAIERARKNRRAAVGRVSEWLDALVLPPALVAEICLDNVETARYNRRVRELAARLRALKLARRAAPHACLVDAAEFAGRLKWQCVVKIRESLLRSIARMQRPHTNVHVVQQTMLKRQRTLYAFLRAHAAGPGSSSGTGHPDSNYRPNASYADDREGYDVASEIQTVYGRLARALYGYFFRTYYQDLSQLDMATAALASSGSAGMAAAAVGLQFGVASQPGPKDTLGAPQRRTSSGVSTDAKRQISEADPSRALALDLPIETVRHSGGAASAVAAIGEGVVSFMGAVTGAIRRGAGFGPSSSGDGPNRPASAFCCTREHLIAGIAPDLAASTAAAAAETARDRRRAPVEGSNRLSDSLKRILGSRADSPSVASVQSKDADSPLSDADKDVNAALPANVSSADSATKGDDGFRSSGDQPSSTGSGVSDDDGLVDRKYAIEDEDMVADLMQQHYAFHRHVQQQNQERQSWISSVTGKTMPSSTASRGTGSDDPVPHLHLIVHHLAQEQKHVYRFEYWFWSLSHLCFDAAASELQFQRQFFGGYVPGVLDDALAVLGEALDTRLNNCYDCVELLLVYCILESQQNKLRRLVRASAKRSGSSTGGSSAAKVDRGAGADEFACCDEEDDDGDEDDDDEFDLSVASGADHEAAMAAALAAAAAVNETAGLRPVRRLRQQSKADSRTVLTHINQFFEAALRRLMARFMDVFARHAESLRKARVEQLGYLDTTGPHYMTRRIVDFSNSLHVIMGVSPSLRANAALKGQLERLRMDFELLMDRFRAHFEERTRHPGRGSGHGDARGSSGGKSVVRGTRDLELAVAEAVFLVNNYGYALRAMRRRAPGTVVGLQLSSTSQSSLDIQLAESIDMFVDREMEARFPRLADCAERARLTQPGTPLSGGGGGGGTVVMVEQVGNLLTLNELLAALAEFRRDWDQGLAVGSLQRDSVRFFTDYELGSRILTRLLARFLELYDLLVDVVESTLASRSTDSATRSRIEKMLVPRSKVKTLVRSTLNTLK